MAAPKIAAVATATPPWRYDQATVLRMSGYDDPRRMGFFNNSLIETRHLYLDPATFTPDESVDQLNERWRRGAVEVGTAAVARAIEQAGWLREDVDFLATTTCTGRVCPSLDAQIINELGLKSTIQRVHVGDTGCASAMVAMQQVSNHLRAFPAHRAVMVAVEICSAAYFLDDRLESAVAHAIFADGAGAIAISGAGPGPERPGKLRLKARRLRPPEAGTWPMPAQAPQVGSEMVAPAARRVASALRPPPGSARVLQAAPQDDATRPAIARVSRRYVPERPTGIVRPSRRPSRKSSRVPAPGTIVQADATPLRRPRSAGGHRSWAVADVPICEVAFGSPDSANSTRYSQIARVTKGALMNNAATTAKLRYPHIISLSG